MFATKFHQVLKNQNYITRFLSGILLIIFVFGITPKRFLHDLVATHIDSKPGATGGQPCQLTTSGYNCDCDSLVAESPFINSEYYFKFPLFDSFSSYVFKSLSFTSSFKKYFLLRGPPPIS